MSGQVFAYKICGFGLLEDQSDIYNKTMPNMTGNYCIKINIFLLLISGR